MRPSFRHLAPDRIQVRRGGGALAIFGLPFFAAGVFVLLAVAGFVRMSNASDITLPGRIGLYLMGLAFTGVGGVLPFGRAWTTIDSTRRDVVQQWGSAGAHTHQHATPRRIHSRPARFRPRRLGQRRQISRDPEISNPQPVRHHPRSVRGRSGC